MDVNHDILAVGTFQGMLGVFDLDTMSITHTLQLQKSSGISQLKLTECGQYMWVSEKNSMCIQCWDLRNMNDVLFTVNRDASTPQRLFFDYLNGILIAGDKNGMLNKIDLNQSIADPCVTFQSIDNAPVCCATFNPKYGMIATAIGERKTTMDLEQDQSNLIESRIDIWM